MLYLAVDGGGTGCRVAVSDAEGRIVGKARGGPSNIASDPDAARENILRAVAQALPKGADPRDAVAVMGLAGANVAERVQQFRSGLAFRRLRIETDAMIATRGALGARDGIVAAIGTGSVFALQQARSVRQIGGWGLVLGDEASGAWLGRTILSRCLHARDGFVAMTPLLTSLLAEKGGPESLVAFATRATPADFAALAPRVAQSDDPAAQVVMAEADAAVFAALCLLGAGPALPVAFLGGLGEVYRCRLVSQVPQVAPIGSALDGALCLAREEA